MNNLAVVILAMLVAGCHWFGPTPPVAPPDPVIPAKTETLDPAPEPGDTGGLCGGAAAISCKSEGDYCRYNVGDCPATSNHSGTCANRPEICTMQYDPVCGCDGKTYGNSCTAGAQRVSIAARGAC